MKDKTLALYELLEEKGLYVNISQRRGGLYFKGGRSVSFLVTEVAYHFCLNTMIDRTPTAPEYFPSLLDIAERASNICAITSGADL